MPPIQSLTYTRFNLALAHSWAIATDVQSGQVRGKSEYPVVFVVLKDAQGRSGLGEASPSSQYGETWETVFRFLGQIDASRLSFDDLSASRAYLESLPNHSMPARCAVDIALLDGAARAARQSLHRFLGLEYPATGALSSFTIGLDTPDRMEAKAREAARYPILKMKLGAPTDAENLAALRRAAPSKLIRVDANAAWKTREEALDRILALADDGNIEFVEQPMPPDTSEADAIWLKEHSPLPLVGDESYQDARDAEHCARCFHGVNVKLVKTGGVTAAKEALEAARALGLKTMLGCMIESSVLISAAAHLASLTDWLDLDGNVLITNDPFEGVRNSDGRITFDGVPERFGLQTSGRAGIHGLPLGRD
jgi:L-alanine-DL-glutamate epimerase-like enolase superfamily enzyme